MSGFDASFDYIVVGGGSAGCVLARRLSAARGAEVALLEAGPSDRHWHVRMPMGNIEALKGERFNWNYSTEPEPHLGRRRLAVPRGKVLGGSSSINGMVHVRGHRRDFDDWARAGCPGWGYADLLPYFRRSESYGGRLTPFRGASGPFAVAPGQGAGALNRAFLAAGAQAGLAPNDDFNGPGQEGVGIWDLAIRNGRRMNAVRAYLEPVASRPNLTVMTGARVRRILMAGSRACGVELLRRGESRRLHARCEVILAAGAIHTPQLLMLSGIGDREALRAFSIASAHHLPGVGRGLQNHIDIYMQYRCRRPITLNGKARPLPRLAVGAQWFLARRGVCASNGFEVGAFLTALDDADRPDTQIVFFPVAFQPGSFDVRPWHGYQFHVGTQKPESRGWVRLASDDPAAPPRIRFNYLATERDRRHIRAAMRRVRELAHAPAFDLLRREEAFPGRHIHSDSDLDRWLIAGADTAYHPVGTCRMGHPSDPHTVVDTECRVIGMEALRIADASIMPSLVNSNPHASVLAIAERAADTILGLAPLPKDERLAGQAAISAHSGDSPASIDT